MRGGRAGKKASVTTAGPCTEVSSGPTKKSAQPTADEPAGVATVTEPPVSASTEVISPEGSACAIEPTRGAAVADGRVGDVRGRPGQQRLDPGGLGVVQQLDVPDQGPDPDPGVVTGGGDDDGVQAGDPVDVHQRGRGGQPHGQQGEQ